MQFVIDLQSLSESRLQLHYAIQLIAATGAALAEPQPDYSHTALRWNPHAYQFVGTLIPALHPFQVALNPITLALSIINEDGMSVAELSLDQRTLIDSLTWLKHEIAKRGTDAETVALLTYPPDDFPDHAIAHGAAFDASDVDAQQHLAYYYHLTYGLLMAIATQTSGAAPVFIWPHHFDMATLVTLSSEEEEESRTVGLGFSPGDQSYPEPYWYVTPYPYPDTAHLPDLDASGAWHTQHWVGAVLTRGRLGNSPAEQIQSFFQSAFHASALLLKTL